MFNIWSERIMPEQFKVLIDGFAQTIGAAAETPDNPFVALPPAHIVLAGGRLKYDSTFMDRAPDLKSITRTGIGYDNVDLPEATKRKIVVCYTPDAPTLATAEHAITLMLCVAKQVRQRQIEIERGDNVDFVTLSRSTQVNDKTLGLIGLGRIGSTVARLATGLGMKIMAYDPFVADQQARELGVHLAVSAEAVLAEADFVSLHLPLSPETRHFMNAERLRQMKEGAFLINCARGGVVDETALVDALDSGRLAGAGLDVFQQEPPPADHPLLNRENVVCTPHVAGGTVEGKVRLWTEAIQQSIQVLKGERPAHVLNPEVYGKM